MTVALVIGSGLDGLEEVRRFERQHGSPDGYVCCNAMIAVWPGPLDAVATYHPEKLGAWTAKREERGYEPPKRIFVQDVVKGAYRRPAHLQIEYVNPRFENQDGCGSSGLFALKVALIDLGFDKAVLCGVPMTSGAHFNKPGAVWVDAMEHRPAWIEALLDIHDRARSMSGWTREILGAPTKDWLI